MKRKPSKLWLVVLRTNLDELPIQLFADKRRALAKARKVTDAEADAAAQIMEVDSAGRIVTALIEFHDGIPKKLELVRDWDETKEAA